MNLAAWWKKQPWKAYEKSCCNNIWTLQNDAKITVTTMMQSRPTMWRQKIINLQRHSECWELFMRKVLALRMLSNGIGRLQIRAMQSRSFNLAFVMSLGKVCLKARKPQSSGLKKRLNREMWKHNIGWDCNTPLARAFLKI